jgi:SH3 domain-containing YSC84-like protein 1
VIKHRLLPAMAVICWSGVAAQLAAETKETATVNAATRTLAEIIATPGKAIPTSLLRDAQAVAIVPRVIKAGLGIGGRRGKGVVLMRDPNGNWANPVFITLTGGSIGWQIGVQSTDVILVFKTKTSLDGFMKGKRLTLGVDAAVAAGPVGREVQASTDGSLEAEIYSYSRSRGLFVGASLDGSLVDVDQRANGSYYGHPGVSTEQLIDGTNIKVPVETEKLKSRLTEISAYVDHPKPNRAADFGTGPMVY